jgi:flagellin
MVSIVTNPVAMQAIRSLSETTFAQTRTQARIESGLRIPTADADPAIFSVTQRMRADVAGWAAVRDSLGLGGAVVQTAAVASRGISDTLATAKASYLQWLALPGEAERRIVRAQIEDLIAQVTTKAQLAVFNGVNLLVVPGGPAASVVRPDDFASLIGTGQGSGSMTYVVAAGAEPGRVVVELDLYGATDRVELWQGAVRVAATGQPTAVGGSAVGPALERTERQTLAFDYSPASGTTLELRFNPGGGGSGWAILDFRLETATVPELQPETAVFNIVRHPSGAVISVGYRDMTSRGLGLDQLNFDDPATGLAQLDAAVRLAAAYAAHFGEAMRRVEAAQASERSVRDALLEGIGALVDADLSAESARLVSQQARAALARESLTIANAAPKALLALFVP